VMSKSRGNVIDPLKTIEKYSADSLRIFLVSMASADKDSVWNSNGLESMHKFLVRIVSSIGKIKVGKSDERVESKLNKTVKEITGDIENVAHLFDNPLFVSLDF